MKKLFMSKKNLIQVISDKPREYVLEMTQEKVDEMKAKGIDTDTIPTVGKHTFRRRNRTINSSEAKIKMTMFIDFDVLQHFKKRAENATSAPYQTQINQELRAIMERDLAEEQNKLDEVEQRLLNNPSFIQAISEKLKAA
jgi:uncharacterized protein (DUF4415 family)